MNRSFAALLLAVFAASSLRAEVLAKVAGDKITREDFDAALAEQQAALKRTLTPEERGTLLRSIVNQRLLVAEARRRKLDRDPNLRAQVLEFERRLLAERLLRDEVEAKAAISLEQAREYYLQNPALFDVAEVSQILVVPHPGDDKAARLKAERLARELAKRPKDFAAVAKRESDDGLSRARGGDLGVLRRGMLLPELEAAVFGAKEGAVLGPVATQFGLHILYVRRLQRLSWEQAGEALQKELQELRARQLQQALLDKLGKSLKVSIEEKQP
jgi:parvulin-like peptidyl-prolyl isomerase